MDELVAPAIIDGRLFRHVVALGKPTVATTEIEGASSGQMIAVRDDLSRIAEAERSFGGLLMSTVVKALFRQLCKENLMEKFPDNVVVELSVRNTTKGGT